MYDDGTSFYGIGMAYCWSVTQAGLTALQNAKCNTWVYWTATMTVPNLIESKSFGNWKDDQANAPGSTIILVGSCRSWMILVIWPHDYLGQNMTGSWENQWSQNAYSTLGNAFCFFTATRPCGPIKRSYIAYMIARWDTAGRWRVGRLLTK